MFSNTDRVTRTDIADLEDEIERIDRSIETIMERSR